MTSDASSSGPGWPGQPASGGTGPGGQSPQQPGQPQQGQWPQQPGQPQQGQWPQQPGQPQQGQWPQQPQQGQWPQQPGQPQQGQWPQQPAQPAQPAQPRPGQWQQPAQPQQGWGQGQAGAQTPQQSQWGQQPGWGQQQAGSQWSQPGQQAGGQWGQTGVQSGQGGQSDWGQQGWSQPGSQWAPTLPSAWDANDPWGSDSYPVDVRFTPEGRIGRYWGIPIIGHLVRVLCLIPHIFVLFFFGILMACGALFTWIPVLFLGRQAHWAYALVGGFLRWSIRVQTWAQLLSGTYPPFSGAESDGQHVRVRIDEDQRINRFWGIPIIGFMVRYIILIPHLVILWLLAFVVWFLLLFAWVPVLVSGRQADLFYSLIGGFVRWQTRVGAYLLLLSGTYPPFRLD